MIHSRSTDSRYTEPCPGQEAQKDDSFLLIANKGGYMVRATREPDLSWFSSFELGEMKRLVEVNADRLASMPHKHDDTREERWAEIKNAVMDVCEVGFSTKREEEGKMSGLILLTEKYTTQIKELESKMAEVQRKLETVTEASRLLEEEGLSEDEPRPRWP